MTASTEISRVVRKRRPPRPNPVRQTILALEQWEPATVEPEAVADAIGVLESFITEKREAAQA